MPAGAASGVAELRIVGPNEETVDTVVRATDPVELRYWRIRASAISPRAGDAIAQILKNLLRRVLCDSVALRDPFLIAKSISRKTN